MVTPSGEAYVVERQPSGEVDDPRVAAGSWFYPVSMAFEGTDCLERGDWTVIPCTRCNGENVETIDALTVSFVVE